MIVFDLQCDKGHVFEGWFSSSADYDEQRAKGLLSCPMCDDAQISKAMMAPNVGRKGNMGPTTTPRVTADVPAATQQVTRPAPAAATQHAPAPAEVRQALETLAKMQQIVEASFEDVGKDFAKEVRKIHYGETEERGIYGDATLDDAQELLEEGIEILPMPFRSRRNLDG